MEERMNIVGGGKGQMLWVLSGRVGVQGRDVIYRRHTVRARRGEGRGGAGTREMRKV